MKKKVLVITLTFAMITNIIGCGKAEEVISINAEAAGFDIIENMDDTTNSENEIETVENTVTEEVSATDEYQYEEQRDIFIVEHIDIGDGTKIDMTDRVSDGKKYTLTESIDIYSFYGTYAGYTKPDIYVGSVGMIDDEWISVSFFKSAFLVKAEDFYRVAVADEDTIETENTVETETTEQIEVAEQPVVVSDGNTQNEEENNTTESTSEKEVVVVDNNKYTPDEAIAVYRSLMEAGGITWDPSLKGVTSWGTGWIYLDKGYPEWAASTNLESFAIGGHGGRSWTKYYLEVTGSDENAVYITQWHSN